MAVYTEVDDEALEAFIALYDIGTVLSLKGIADGVENSNYLLHTSMGSYILTLYEKRVDADDLPFFLGLMNHLASKGVACPTPIVQRSGDMLGTLSGRPAAIVSFLEGVWPKKPLPRHCAELGAGLAKLHLAGRDFDLTRANALSVSGWRPLYNACRGRTDGIIPGLGREIEDALDFFDAHWPTDLPSGVIHADPFPDNVFFLQHRLSGFIDFYFACNDALVYDLAICLNAWCFEPDGAFNISKARALLQSYSQVRPLCADELAALPVLARGSALRFLLTRTYDWINHPPGALVRPKDPREYLGKMRFHRDVTSPSAYGLDL
ncbi:MAG: homoserine kinase [Alphaproteobacteria bacterium]|nr:homoserine kinase [Alphaproteobacteria bacterium]MBO6627933.1 homoserine kinase [Alphaproteobacteria bacterium]MDF1625503.1 homoserine kinase [Parvibaculaceae bacterium]